MSYKYMLNRRQSPKWDVYIDPFQASENMGKGVREEKIGEHWGTFVF